MLNPTLILSATVHAQSCAGMFLRDVQARIDNYCFAIESYLQYPEINLVFSENSNCDLSEFQARFGGHPNLELLTFDGNHFTSSLGKGQGENESITFALHNSKLLKEKAVFFKVSGRYFSCEIPKIMVDYDDSQYDGVFELIPANQAANNVLTVFFGLKKETYLNRIANAVIDDGQGLIYERVMFVAIQDLNIQWLPPIRYHPTIIGGSGQVVTTFPP